MVLAMALRPILCVIAIVKALMMSPAFAATMVDPKI